MQTTAGRLGLNALLWLAELGQFLQGSEDNSPVELQSVLLPSSRTKLCVSRAPGSSTSLVLHLHGGGWTIGNSRMSDRENARLAARLEATVMSYRLPPRRLQRGGRTDRRVRCGYR